MTARDIVIRKLTAAQQVVSALEDVLEDIDALEAGESAPADPTGEPGGDAPAEEEEEEPTNGARPSANGHARTAAPAGGWEPTPSQRGHGEKIAQALDRATGPLSAQDVSNRSGIPLSTVFKVLGELGTKAPPGKAWFRKLSSGGYEATDHARREVLSGE